MFRIVVQTNCNSKKMNRKITKLGSLLCMMLFIQGQVAVVGQERAGMVKYTPEFKFKDGIYLNFEQVKQNSPISKAKLLSSTDYNDREFFKKLFEKDNIYYYDDIGVRQELGKNSIWGYSRNGILYIQVQAEFNRITFIGSICHFVADITTEDRYYGSPYGYYNPYSPYASSYYYSPYYSPYYNPYYPYGNSRRSTRTELKQFIIDWETGRVMDFDVDNTKLLLMKDPELHEEFARLSRKKKKDLLFVYIRKFDEKYPLYVPVD